MRIHQPGHLDSVSLGLRVSVCKAYSLKYIAGSPLNGGEDNYLDHSIADYWREGDIPIAPYIGAPFFLDIQG
jgi:hypothetical protein